MDLTDWKDTFIKLTKKVTIDEAALVAASINPFSVNSSILDATNGGFDSWPTAKMVARLLRDAVAVGDIAVIEASIDTCQGYNEILSGDTLLQHMDSNPSHRISNATFLGKDVWQWMVYHRLIDLKYGEGYSPSRDRLIAIMSADRASQNATDHNGEHIQNLTKQIAELTERLQQAEKEIEILKARATHFRHMTPLLELVAEVQDRYWGENWDQSDPDTNTRQYDIVEWIKADPRCGKNNKGEPSEKRAEMVAIVAKPITRSPSNSPPEP